MKQPLYLYTFVAALGGLLFGFDTAVINGAIPFFTQHFGLSDAMKGWAVSSALIGCVLGALMVGRPGDYFGRRQVLRVLALLFLISAIGSGLSWSFGSFVAFRVIGGLAIGGASVLSPLYIAEIAPAAFRGRLAITFQLAIVVGILVAFFSDYLLLNTGVNNWRWMFMTGALPAVVFFILLFRVRESPRWLVMKGYIHQARQVLDELNTGTDTGQLLNEIRDSVNTEVLGKAVYLFKKPYLKLVMIGIAVGMFNQFTGINIVMYYTTDIFRAANFSTDSASVTVSISTRIPSNSYFSTERTIASAMIPGSSRNCFILTPYSRAAIMKLWSITGIRSLCRPWRAEEIRSLGVIYFNVLMS